MKCVVRDGSVAAPAHADEGHGGGAGPRPDSKRGKQYYINTLIWRQGKNSAPKLIGKWPGEKKKIL